MTQIRSPIISVLGHVDHGKTSLLDKIRGSAIAKSEPGAITQHISSSYVSSNVIENLCGTLMQKLGIKSTTPGLLFIDSPGHEAFTTLRKRGGSIADIAILVIDVNEGFQPQTDESLNFLKQFKTPFVVAATKIDRTLGWNSTPDLCFIDSIKNQQTRTYDELEGKIYSIAGQLSQRGFEAERYDRVTDFKKYVSIVPVSSKTGEGIADLIVVLTGVCQKFLTQKLCTQADIGKGTILEVKEAKGLGVTVDVILYDGSMNIGDTLIIGGRQPTVTKIKALLEPAQLEDIRAGKEFHGVHSVSAAIGVKIAAPSLDEVIAGMPVRALRPGADTKTALHDIAGEIEEVEFESQVNGVILKTDTLGSLEALVKSLINVVPVRKAHVGKITRPDIMEAKTLSKPVILAFGIKPSQEIEALAKDNGVKLFCSDVIYKLIEDYKKYEQDLKNMSKQKILETVPRPAKVKVLRNCVFRQKKPAVFGIEVLAGTIKPGYRLEKDGTIVGTIKEIQNAGQNVKEAKAGDKVAISVPELTIGKEVNENDDLHIFLTNEERQLLNKVSASLRDDERSLLSQES